jgi:hypothetical protein
VAHHDDLVCEVLLVVFCACVFFLRNCAPYAAMMFHFAPPEVWTVLRAHVKREPKPWTDDVRFRQGVA